jgi:hypothetical protein
MCLGHVLALVVLSASAAKISATDRVGWAFSLMAAGIALVTEALAEPPVVRDVVSNNAAAAAGVRGEACHARRCDQPLLRPAASNSRYAGVIYTVASHEARGTR